VKPELPKQSIANPPQQTSRSIFSFGLDDLDEEAAQLVEWAKETTEEELPGPDLDPNLISTFWNYLKARPELTDLHSLNAILQLRKLEIQGSKLCFVLANDFEWRFVEANRQWLTDLARQQLKSPTLQITYRIDPDLEAAEAERIRQQSPEYRIQQMIATNPHLKTMIDRFGLQPE
jgi:hypothetical protein